MLVTANEINCLLIEALIMLASNAQQINLGQSQSTFTILKVQVCNSSFASPRNSMDHTRVHLYCIRCIHLSASSLMQEHPSTCLQSNILAEDLVSICQITRLNESLFPCPRVRSLLHHQNPRNEFISQHGLSPKEDLRPFLLRYLQ